MMQIHHLRTRRIYEFYLGVQIMSIVTILVVLNIFKVFDEVSNLQIRVFAYLYGVYILFKLHYYIRKAYFQNQKDEQKKGYTSLLIAIIDMLFLTSFLHFTNSYFHILSHLFYFYITFQSILFHHKSHSIFSTLAAIGYLLLTALNNRSHLFTYASLIHIALFYLLGYILSTVIKEINQLEYSISFMNNELTQKNQQLSEMANKDFLTNMYNHKCFYFHFCDFIKKTEISYSPFSVALLDIDNFKKINDTYGHLVGDMILKEISLLILNNIRKTDIAARYGGEEFAIIFPNTSLDEAKFICERIRSSIERHIFHVNSDLLKVTISGGVQSNACFSSSYQPHGFLDSVDQLLYKAKSLGKNQILSA